MRPSRHIALLFALFATIALFAQPAVLVEANKFYQAGDLKSARAILDGAVKDPVIGGGPEAWVLRGFVYKDLYKAHPGDAGADALRDEAAPVSTAARSTLSRIDAKSDMTAALRTTPRILRALQ